MLLTLKSKIDDKELIRNLRRRIIQQTEILKKTINRNGSDIQIKCQNDSTLTWEKAITDLIEMQNSNIHGFTGPSYLTIDEVKQLQFLIMNCVCIFLNAFKLIRFPQRTFLIFNCQPIFQFS